MSDRRRYPKKDDWDDDLDLVGFDRPAPPSSSSREQSYDPAPARTSRSRTYPGAERPIDPEIDDLYPASPETRRPRTERRYPSEPSPYDDRGYRSADPYETDPYQAIPEDRSYPDRGYDAPRSGRSADAGSRYGSDFTDQPPARSSRSRSRQSAPIEVDPEYASGYPDAAYAEAAYHDDARYPEPVNPARRPSRTREPRQRPAVSVPMPAINDGITIAAVAASLLSIVFMIASIAAGSGGLADWFPIHLDASGNPDVWGTKDTLWRIPLGSLIALLMALVVAALLWKRDRFAARFALFGTLLLQVLAWVALIDFIW
ncbi:MAG: hypothetical protein KF883_05195 [Thermomicrobiales bacterium]|nr:hypothetical protein [Thermomicrobiales bacterium]